MFSFCTSMTILKLRSNFLVRVNDENQYFLTHLYMVPCYAMEDVNKSLTKANKSHSEYVGLFSIIYLLIHLDTQKKKYNLVKRF